jgi:hypothetical protein
MAENNAYKFVTAEGWEDVESWWYGSKNPFSHHGHYDLGDNVFLLMADPSAEIDAVLESCEQVKEFYTCRVDSPQVGDKEPGVPHDIIDAGDQLLWVYQGEETP